MTMFCELPVKKKCCVDTYALAGGRGVGVRVLAIITAWQNCLIPNRFCPPRFALPAYGRDPPSRKFDRIVPRSHPHPRPFSRLRGERSEGGGAGAKRFSGISSLRFLNLIDIQKLCRYQCPASGRVSRAVQKCVVTQCFETEGTQHG